MRGRHWKERGERDDRPQRPDSDLEFLPTPDFGAYDLNSLANIYRYVTDIRETLKSGLACKRGWGTFAKILMEKEWPPEKFDPSQYTLEELKMSVSKHKAESPREYMRRVMDKISPERFADTFNRLIGSQSEAVQLKAINLLSSFGGLDISDEMDTSEPPRTQFSSFLLGKQDEEDDEED